jgi:hypothetical protein
MSASVVDDTARAVAVRVLLPRALLLWSVTSFGTQWLPRRALRLALLPRHDAEAFQRADAGEVDLAVLGGIALGPWQAFVFFVLFLGGRVSRLQRKYILSS